MSKKINLFANLKSDFASGLVVFLVALPLCLGIAMASGAPLFSGIISGVIGGIVVGYLSQSHISVTGPAAGLTAIILTAITDLGAFDVFLTAVFIAGLIQLGLGFLKAGSISNYFPTNVIEGMLAGIGVIIILKQIPHALGYDTDFEGDQSFVQHDGNNSFTALFEVFNHIQLGAVIVTAVSLVILISWDKLSFLKKLKLIPGALVAVILGIILNEWFIQSGSALAISQEHLVNLPIPQSFEEFKAIIVTPNFAGIMNPQVWVVGLTIAIVASIETLLCIEASDRMDVQKRYTNTNVELKAQGIGNMVSSLLGGLPMTSVVVRSSANNNAGAKSKMSAIIHGFLLMISVLSIPMILNKIPLATLATILILVGYKLAKPATFIHFWEKGKYQFVPFIATLVAVVATDLLKGVLLGIVISVIFILRGNLKRAYSFKKEEYVDGDIIHIDLAQEVSFLNKAAIKLTLNEIPENSKVIINAHDTVYIAHDILDLIREFKTTRAIDENIKVKLKGFKKAYDLENTPESPNHVTFEHYYDVAKRVMVKKEKVSEVFQN
ncbi:SulP family inorganic anion transporter [Flavobacterium granuli]|uniref:MFS superfamily sulfate permease-like transporter n=1 Tax=Flavobacterium granuli TaxID=280093 RepID=A0A1M5LWX5_9FLAO|nr:SulP family inorganic anion transporter [Flavobacterium granuli]PRZ24132.1 MFS superfamily sulfate permease-like transporter [Flavobacterium granuli]SHG69511.1 Sulfate permease, MFS superfamily [Flavobacterium granuli]